MPRPTPPGGSPAPTAISPIRWRSTTRQFQKLNAVTDFLVSDQVGWDAPASVEAGAGGDFYALDHHRDRILRIDANGKIVKAYALPHFDKCPAQGFRVCEKAQAFYVLFAGRPELQCLGFDGKLKWQRPIGVSTNTYDGDSGGFDVDDDGVLYAIASQDDVLRKIGPDGKPAGEIKLNIPPEHKLAEGIHGHARVGRRGDPARPASQRVVPGVRPVDGRLQALGEHRPRAVDRGGPRRAMDRRRNRWRWPIDFDGGGRPIRPQWRVWARPFGVLDYRELKLADGKLQVPDDFAGFYQIKVTPEANPWQQGAARASTRCRRSWRSARRAPRGAPRRPRR